MRHVLFIVLLTATTYCQAVSSGWTEYGYVAELVPTIHHRFKVNIELKGNNSSCKQSQWFYQDYGSSGAKEMYLALLEAVSSNKLVRVYVTGRCNLDDYSEISELGIRS